MPPDDADFAIEIKFVKGEGNPRRVFDAASLLIDGFERLDEAALGSIGSSLESALVLEDIEEGSIKIWLKNLIAEVDDDALKKMDWKTQVGNYLVRTKYAVLRWLDDEGRPGLPALKDSLQKIAEETEVRHLPDYPPIHDARLLGALDRIQDGKRQLGKQDRLYIETERETYEVDLLRDWLPTATIAPDASREIVSAGHMILTVHKPDLIGAAQWKFKHGTTSVSASINDADWLSRYRGRQIPVLPGDALRAAVRFVYTYDAAGALKGQRIEIERVLEVIQAAGPQQRMDGL